MTSQVLSAADSKSIFFVKFSDLGYVCMLWGSFHHILSNVMAFESFYSDFIDEKCKIYSHEWCCRSENVCHRDNQQLIVRIKLQLCTPPLSSPRSLLLLPAWRESGHMVTSRGVKDFSQFANLGESP